MSQLCQTIQVGRVGKIKEVGSNLIISIASDASYKKDGEWQDRTLWVEHTLFARQEATIKWAREKLQPGDLVSVRSTPSQTRWEKDGKECFGYTFAIEELRREVAKADLKSEEDTKKPAPKKGR
jgi:single-stranded DNA-binding protein